MFGVSNEASPSFKIFGNIERERSFSLYAPKFKSVDWWVGFFLASTSDFLCKGSGVACEQK